MGDRRFIMLMDEAISLFRLKEFGIDSIKWLIAYWQLDVETSDVCFGRCDACFVCLRIPSITEKELRLAFCVFGNSKMDLI